MLDKKIGISKCIYYSNLDVLYIAGYALPKAERCEIWNGENLVCQARMGIRRQDLLGQKPEYGEEYAGWDIAVYMDRDISARIRAKVYYNDNTWLEQEKEISCQTYEKEYAETEAWYMGRQCMLEAFGITGAKTQRIEIWNAQECLGTVSEWGMTERKIGATSIPFRSWRVEIKALQEMPAQVYLRYFDEVNNIVEKELKIKKWSVPLDKRIGISKCIYYKGAARLLVEGWSLSRVADCGIYIEDNFYGNAQLDLPREDILEKHARYEWDAPGWKAIVAYGGKTDAVIELRFNFFDGKSVNVECTINEIVAIDKIECQESFYLPNEQKLIISGKAVNLDNNIRIWNDGKYIGEIKRKDYQKSDELGRSIWKKCFHNVKIGSNTICLKDQNGSGGENFYGEIAILDSAEKIHDSSIYKLSVNKAEYIPVVDQIHLTGWCLPLPEKMEVVIEGRREECELRQLRNDVYLNMKWYNENRSGWACTIHNIDQPVGEVILKIYYGEGDCIEQVVSIKTLEKKLISFDMFDTLVERPVLEPTNLFKLVAKRCGLPYQFVYMRTNAERFARENNQRMDREVDLEDIYAALALILRCTPEELEVIKQTEIEVELQYLRVKRSGRLLYEKALRENKDIVIVTDMYLPKEVIKKCLENNGYVQYKKIYLSHEYRTSKSDGGLYDIMIADAMENGILPGEILHIGDNRKVDMVMAKQKGLDSVIESKSVEKLRKNELASSFFHHSAGEADNCFMKGFWANYMAALETEEREGTDTRYIRLAAIFAPILIEFTIWMMNDCHERGCDKIVWVYRDGYLFEKISKILAPYVDYSIDSKKIYLSRAVRCNGYVEEENGFFQAWIDYPVYEMKVKDFVENRLLVDQEQEKEQVLDMIFTATGKSPEDCVGDISDYFEIFAKMEDIYIKHAQENMEVLRKYCSDILGNSHKIAVFDIGYQGKSANFLRMISEKDIVTYQLLGKDLVGEDIDNKSYIRYSNRFFDNLRILHPIFEDIVSSPENSTKRIRMVNGDFLREVGGKTIENGVISRIQEEILKFTVEFVELFGKDVMNLRFEHFPEFNLACDFLIRPCRELAEVIAKFEFGDSEFLNKVQSSIYRDWYDEKIVLDR